MKKSVFLLLLIIPASVCMTQNNKASKDGLSLLASAGSISGGIGIRAEYQIRADIFTFIVLFAGTGVAINNKFYRGTTAGIGMGYKF